MRIGLRSGIAMRVRSRAALREIRWLEISGLLPPAAIRLGRPAILALLRGLRIGLRSPLIDGAILIRAFRLSRCRSALVTFMPRTVGSRIAICIAIGPARSFTIRLFRACAFRVVPPRAVRLLRASGLAFAGLRADGAHFIGSDPDIAVAVEPAENVGGLGEFSGINDAVVIRIKRVE